MAEIEPGELESRLAILVAREVEQLRAELRERIELLLDEQRVCFKQMALELSEAVSVAKRNSNNVQLRLDELAGRIEQLGALQAEIEELRGASEVHQDLT